jgi:hypothetical protein
MPQDDGAGVASEVHWELRGPDGELKARGGSLPKDTTPIEDDEEIPR